MFKSCVNHTVAVTHTQMRRDTSHDLVHDICLRRRWVGEREKERERDRERERERERERGDYRL